MFCQPPNRYAFRVRVNKGQKERERERTTIDNTNANCNVPLNDREQFVGRMVVNLKFNKRVHFARDGRMPPNAPPNKTNLWYWENVNGMYVSMCSARLAAHSTEVRFCIRCNESSATPRSHTPSASMLNYDDKVRVAGFILSGSGGEKVLKKRVNHDSDCQLANCVVCNSRISRQAQWGLYETRKMWMKN